MRIVLVLTLALISYGTSASAFDPVSDEPAEDARFPAAITELSISHAGDRMPGHIYQAQGEGPHPTVVLLHGLPGNERNLDIAQVLRRAGFNVLFFHYRGAWGAEGRYAMSQLDDDALAVLRFLRQPDKARELRVDTQNLSVLGHSLGGFTALAAGRTDEQLKCVVSLSPANLGVWKRTLQAGQTEALEWLTDYADSLYMLNGFNSKTMLADMANTPLSEFDTASFGPGLRGKSVLMVVGDRDRVTPADTMFKPVIAAYSQHRDIDLQQHIISGDHSFSGTRLALTRLILDWMQTHCR